MIIRRVSLLLILSCLLRGFTTNNIATAKEEENSPSPQQNPSQKIASDLVTKATRDQLPHISSSILRTEMEREEDPSQKTSLAIQLATLLIHQGEKEEALSLVQTPGLQETPSLLFWRAEALLQNGKSAAAATLLQNILNSEEPFSPNDHHQEKAYRNAALISLAMAHRLLGENQDALDTIAHLEARKDSSLTASLKLLLQEEKLANLLQMGKEKEADTLLKTIPSTERQQEPRLLYYQSLIALSKGDTSEAVHLLHQIRSYDSWLKAASISVAAEAHQQNKQITGTQLLLEKYLEETPDSPLMEQLMGQLEMVYLLEKNNDTTLLSKWSQDNSHPQRAKAALLPYIRMLSRLGHYEEAQRLLTQFLATSHDSLLSSKATLELAEIKLLQGNPEESLALVTSIKDPSVKADAKFLAGLAQARLAAAFSAQETEASQNKLEKNPPQEVIKATPAASSYSTSAINAMSAAKAANAALTSFEEAAVLDPRLAATAQENQHLITESLISTRESNLTPPSKEPSTNSKIIQQPHSTTDKTPSAEEAYRALFDTSATQQKTPEEQIAAARQFLEEHPESPLKKEVTLKLGESLLKNHQPREARKVLENLGWAESGTELGRKALLLAAEAAATSMTPQGADDALILLEEVAREGKGGVDTWQARLEQAALKNQENLPREAVAIYDQIITEEKAPPALQATALMAKGDTLHNLGIATGGKNQNTEQSIACWQQLAQDSSFPVELRTQALCKSGITEEQLGDHDAALTDYYRAMKEKVTPPKNQRWHDMAAFRAAELLEKEKNWRDAIHIYQAIEAEKGPRATEATNRISKLRLENFLWDE